MAAAEATPRVGAVTAPLRSDRISAVSVADVGTWKTREAPMRTLLIAAALVSSANTAAAQPAEGRRFDGRRPAVEGGGPVAGGLFLSPSGEPYRGADGRAAWFAQADADHDGALTRPELQADAERFFKVVDQDADGVIVDRENRRYESEIAPEITRMAFDRGPRDALGAGPGEGPPGDRPRKRGGAPGGAQGAARWSPINEPQPIRGADLNLDYRVTAEEWRKATDRRFSRLDRNGDDRITSDELGPPGDDRGEGRPPRPPR